MNITIYIASLQKGFLLGLAKLLSREHRVSIVAQDANVAFLVRNHVPELSGQMDIVDDYVPDEIVDPVSEALALEKRYAVTCSFLLSHDRGVGRGYVFNIDRYPHVGRSTWSHERKLKYILQKVKYVEHVFTRFEPDCLLGYFPGELFSLVAGKNGVPYLNLVSAKLGTRRLWSDDAFMTNPRLYDSIQAYLKDPKAEQEAVPEFEQETVSKVQLLKARYSWGTALRGVLSQVFAEVKKILRGTRRKDSYCPFGWLPSILGKPLAYKFLSRNGRTPQDLSDRRVVYIPLHMEPEIALLGLSPEFNNTMEMVAWVSKSLPADAIIVIKEQPHCMGLRSLGYYKRLLQIGNVALAHPDTGSWDWIKASDLVVTITGTAAIEAVHFGRPVLSFGLHQIVNVLPSVCFADSYKTTVTGVSKLLGLERGGKECKVARYALYKAQEDNSFELPGFEHLFTVSEPCLDVAEQAIAELQKDWPELFKQPRAT